MKKIKSAIFPAVLALVWLTGLILAGIYDFDISNAVADPLSGFGRLLEIIGEPPAILFASFNFALIAAYLLSKPKKSRRDGVLAVLSLIGQFGTAYYTVHRTFKYIAEYRSDLSGTVISTGIAEIIISAVICGILGAAMLTFAFRLRPETLERVYGIAVHCVFAAISTFVIIWCFKLLWGRVRFRQLDGDFSRFTSWFLPQGYTGYFSFPSGHTANAAVIFTSVYYLRLLPENRRWLVKPVYLLLTLWIILLALSRILVGAHYLSDVLCGAAITFAIVYFWRPKDAKK